MVNIAQLNCVEEIEQCEKLPIAQKLWGTENSIESFGQMGYVEDEELVVKLTAIEQNPLTSFTQDNDPVYQDSALEVFLNFNPDKDLYMNFEVNSNGALLCHFGRKGQRSPVSFKEDTKVSVEVVKKEDKWWVLLRISQQLIRDYFGEVKFQKGCVMAFNMYKICETTSNLHFISHTFIPTEKPDFHQPAYFAKGVLK